MKDRNVLITGATGGLGGAVTQLLLSRGAAVTATFIDDAERDALSQTIAAKMPGAADRVDFVRADLTAEDSVRDLVMAMPKIDALVHLVGGFTMGPTHEVSLEHFRAHHDLCVITTFLACKHALGRMKSAGYGRIVTIGSRAVTMPMAQMAAYASAKSAVVALTQVIAAETKGTNVTANCVLPSVIDTPANRSAMGSEDAATWVTPARLAETIAFLASEAAADIRGAALPVFGSV